MNDTLESKKLKDRGKRLWKNYHWTNEMYADLFDLQDGKCAGCGRPPRNAPLNVDHEHFKVLAHRIADGNWYAWTKTNGKEFDAVQYTKKEAVQVCRDRALPYSVRGLLCPGRQRGCNRLLGRVDNIHLLENFIEYLKNPPAQKILDKS